ncbi:MAG: energy transducer TonB, partial [Pyrinomonadaceae bacterium]
WGCRWGGGGGGGGAVSGAAATMLEEAPPPPPAPKPTPKPIPRKISLGVLNGKATHLVTPPYPPAAKAVHASGAVQVQVSIDTSGNVVSASAISGHPLLKQAAEQAARQSKFSPTMLSGQPVAVSGLIVYNFVAQ